MAYKQCAGRGPLQKTGRDIPLNMKSPLYQTKRKDVPEGATFGKSTTIIDESDGMTVTTTPYSKEGTPSSKKSPEPQMPDADWTALVEKRKQENKGPINPPGPGPTPSGTPSTKGTKGQSGSVETRSFNFKPRELAPLGANQEMSGLTFAKRTLPPKTISHGGEVTTTIGKIKKGVKKVTSNLKINKVLGTSKGGFKPGCLTD
jgi:hypothetical protein